MDQLFNAMTTIVDNRLSKIHYDKTIICTITDNSQKNEGIYKVSNSLYCDFEAIGEGTDYNNGQQVYVIIPQGDYTQTKLISGLVTSTTEAQTVINEKRALDSYTPLTENLMPIGSEITEIDGDITTKSFDLNIPNTSNNYKQLGLSFDVLYQMAEDADADFNEREKAIKYGFVLQLGFCNSKTDAEKVISKTDTNVTTVQYNMDIDVTKIFDNPNNEFVMFPDDFDGNQFSYFTPTHQEALFNLEPFGYLCKGKLIFVAFGLNSDDTIDVKNIETTLGLDLTSDDYPIGDSLLLTTDLPTEYPNDIKSDIIAHWIYKDDEGKVEIKDKQIDDTNYSIHWFKNTSDASYKSKYTDYFWNDLTETKIEYDKNDEPEKLFPDKVRVDNTTDVYVWNNLVVTLQNLAKEEYFYLDKTFTHEQPAKIIQEIVQEKKGENSGYYRFFYLKAESLKDSDGQYFDVSRLLKLDLELEDEEGKKPTPIAICDFLDTEDGEKYWTLLIPYTYKKNKTPMVLPFSDDLLDVTLPKVEVKAIIIDNETDEVVCESNILTFTNASEVNIENNIDIIQNLTINTNDGYNGNYCIYNQNGYDTTGLGMISAVANFDQIRSGFDNIDKEDLSVIWRIPAVRTMFSVGTLDDNWVLSEDTQYYEYKQLLTFDKEKTVEEKIEKVYNEGEMETFLLLLTGQSMTRSIASPQIPINNLYNSNLTNNYIKCIITKGKFVDESTFNVTFGTKGSSGTQYTFRIVPVDNNNAMFYKNSYKEDTKTYNSITLKAVLIDPNGIEVQPDNISWSWYYNTTNSDYTMSVDEVTKQVTISLKNPTATIDIEKLSNYVIKATATYSNVKYTYTSTDTSGKETKTEVNTQATTFEDYFPIRWCLNDIFQPEVPFALWYDHSGNCLNQRYSINMSYNGKKINADRLKELSTAYSNATEANEELKKTQEYNFSALVGNNAYAKLTIATSLAALQSVRLGYITKGETLKEKSNALGTIIGYFNGILGSKTEAEKIMIEYEKLSNLSEDKIKEKLENIIDYLDKNAKEKFDFYKYLNSTTAIDFDYINSFFAYALVNYNAESPSSNLFKYVSENSEYSYLDQCYNTLNKYAITYPKDWNKSTYLKNLYDYCFSLRKICRQNDAEAKSAKANLCYNLIQTMVWLDSKKTNNYGDGDYYWDIIIDNNGTNLSLSDLDLSLTTITDNLGVILNVPQISVASSETADFILTIPQKFFNMSSEKNNVKLQLVCYKFSKFDSDKVLTGIPVFATPLIYLQDNYGFNWINEWDGSTFIDAENGRIMTSILTAGTKNKANQFTGTIIGDIEDGEQNYVILSQNKGSDIFSVTREGTVTAAAGKIGGWNIGQTKNKNGQTIKQSERYSGDTNIFYSDPCIVYDDETKKEIVRYEFGIKCAVGQSNWANFYVAKKPYSKEIPDWKNVFYVTNAGKLYAENAEIKGKITASSGTIGGFTIGTSALWGFDSSNKIGEVGLGVGNTAFWAGYSPNEDWLEYVAFPYLQNKLYVYVKQVKRIDLIGENLKNYIGYYVIKVITSDKKFDHYSNNTQTYFKDGETLINISSKNSSKNWITEKITTNFKYDETNTKNLISLFKIPDLEENTSFYVSRNGKLYAQNANIQGKINATSGKIGGFEIFDDRLRHEFKNETSQVSDGMFLIKPVGSANEYEIAGQEQKGWAFILGPDFGITTKGKLYASGGKIASWYFGKQAEDKDMNYVKTNSGLYSIDRDSTVYEYGLKKPGSNVAAWLYSGIRKETKDTDGKLTITLTPTFTIARNGALTCTEINANGDIKAGYVTTKNNKRTFNSTITLNGSDGSISCTSIKATPEDQSLGNVQIGPLYNKDKVLIGAAITVWGGNSDKFIRLVYADEGPKLILKNGTGTNNLKVVKI